MDGASPAGADGPGDAIDPGDGPVGPDEGLPPHPAASPPNSSKPSRMGFMKLQRHMGEILPACEAQMPAENMNPSKRLAFSGLKTP